ncbi:MAG: TetR/AcrR family transcriptional regulator [bacterium]|nr:TetR/AcrR family transcriptional regulator [bacterium]
MSRAEQKAEAHSRIVAAAARQIREEGLSGAGVQRIMEEAGLTHGGFYGHFDSKEELLGEALKSAMAIGRNRLRVPDAASRAERRESMLSVYLSRAHRDNPGVGCPLPSTSAEVARAPESLRRAYDEELRETIASFEKELSDSQDEDAHTRAVGTLALCVGSLVLARAALDSELSDDILDSSRQFAAETKETK